MPSFRPNKDGGDALDLMRKELGAAVELHPQIKPEIDMLKALEGDISEQSSRATAFGLQNRNEEALAIVVSLNKDIQKFSTASKALNDRLNRRLSRNTSGARIFPAGTNVVSAGSATSETSGRPSNRSVANDAPPPTARPTTPIKAMSATVFIAPANQNLKLTSVGNADDSARTTMVMRRFSTRSGWSA